MTILYLNFLSLHELMSFKRNKHKFISKEFNIFRYNMMCIFGGNGRPFFIIFEVSRSNTVVRSLTHSHQ